MKGNDGAFPFWTDANPSAHSTGRIFITPKTNENYEKSHICEQLFLRK